MLLRRGWMGIRGVTMAYYYDCNIDESRAWLGIGSELVRRCWYE